MTNNWSKNTCGHCHFKLPENSLMSELPIIVCIKCGTHGCFKCNPTRTHLCTKCAMKSISDRIATIPGPR